MKISGTKVADEIRKGLRSSILSLKTRGITPKVAIITLGPEDSWEAYIKQKLRVAEELGIIAELINLRDANEDGLIKKIDEINRDQSIHGIIAQRPMPSEISRTKVTNSIDPIKDIDGFRDDSPYEVPVWLAVKKLLGESGTMNPNSAKASLGKHELWEKLSFVVIGKGETAGGPVIRGLKKMGIEPIVIDSKTQNPDEVIRSADVIISAVGKSRVVQAENIKPGVVLIGVGTHNEKGKLEGDYVEEEIENVAGSYTPTPFGVGPVNLSYLFSNLIEAAKSISIK